MVQRAGRRAISGANHDLYQLFRPSVGLLVVGSMFIWVGIAGVVLILEVVAPAAMPYVAGAAIASYFWFVAFLYRTDDPFTARRMGGRAERWTSEELHRLDRQGWHVIDAVEFKGFDVDHVLIGPGGVFAIETKWAGVPVQVTSSTVEVFSGDAAVQARLGARKIQMLLKAGGVEADVHPIVVLWGQGAPSLAGGRLTVDSDRGSVLVMEGRVLEESLDAFDVDRLDRDDLNVIRHVVDNFVAERDARIALEKSASRGTTR